MAKKKKSKLPDSARRVCVCHVTASSMAAHTWQANKRLCHWTSSSFSYNCSYKLAWNSRDAWYWKKWRYFALTARSQKSWQIATTAVFFFYNFHSICSYWKITSSTAFEWWTALGSTKIRCYPKCLNKSKNKTKIRTMNLRNIKPFRMGWQMAADV